MSDKKLGEKAAGGMNCSAMNILHKAEKNARIPTWKRVLDLTCILLTLPCWLPLMLLIAFGIKLISPGPILFRQVRVGHKGRQFICLKFRSMKADAETRVHENYLKQLIQTDCPMTKLDASDHRLIPFGRIFRATGLDELPQLFNIIRGEMSLVGPRPCTPEEFQSYTEHQKKRADAPPGLTGYWQVNGKNKTTFSEMIAMDIYYASNRSPWLDLWILLKTVPSIMSHLLESRAANHVRSENCKPLQKQVSQ